MAYLKAAAGLGDKGLGFLFTRLFRSFTFFLDCCKFTRCEIASAPAVSTVQRPFVTCLHLSLRLQ